MSFVSFLQEKKSFPPASEMQCLFRALIDALKAKDALRAVLSRFPLIIRHLDVHRADAQALATGNALVRIALDPQQREITHGLQKHRDRTEILAERSVVMQPQRKEDPCGIVERVADEKAPEHDARHVRYMQQKQHHDIQKR